MQLPTLLSLRALTAFTQLMFGGNLLMSHEQMKRTIVTNPATLNPNSNFPTGFAAAYRSIWLYHF